MCKFVQFVSAIVCLSCLFSTNVFADQDMLSRYLNDDIWEGSSWTKEEIEFALTENITEHTELSTEQASNVLLNDMSAYTEELLNADEKGVKFEVISSIIALETGHMTSSVWEKYNNPGGITFSNGEYACYSTPEEGIDALCELLVNQYIDEDGAYYIGSNNNVMGLAQHYNTNIEWVKLYVDVRLSQLHRVETE